jgi:phage terminase large subunit-like protein
MNDFAKAGDLTIIDDLGDDIAAVVTHVQRLEDAGILAGNASVGLDPYGVGSVIDALAEAGIGDERVVAVSQGYKLQGAIKTTERKLADGTLRHCVQPIMDWCVGNAKIELKGNAAMITKQASGVAKIDPLMALFDAAALMSMNPEPRSRPTIFDYSELWGVA